MVGIRVVSTVQWRPRQDRAGVGEFAVRIGLHRLVYFVFEFRQTCDTRRFTIPFFDHSLPPPVLKMFDRSIKSPSVLVGSDSVCDSTLQPLRNATQEDTYINTRAYRVVLRGVLTLRKSALDSSRFPSPLNELTVVNSKSARLVGRKWSAHCQGKRGWNRGRRAMGGVALRDGTELNISH